MKLAGRDPLKCRDAEIHYVATYEEKRREAKSIFLTRTSISAIMQPLHLTARGISSHAIVQKEDVCRRK